MKLQDIILASTSPRRKALLEQIGLPYTAIASGYEEDMLITHLPDKLVQELAYNKAKDVALGREEGIIIGADTILALPNPPFCPKILGKPHHERKARDTLHSISGRTIQAYTGLAIIDATTDKEYKGHAMTNVKIKSLSHREMEWYLRTGEPFDKAGAIGIQGRGAAFVEHIQGDYTTVVGLPIPLLLRELEDFGIQLYNQK